ncbi:MAG: DUF4956 domain-containing protein [Candidatus Saccharibacteria bacterium]|nr:DUF4956 domain-containing protein [Candidatus Saccharibacteria bacterium]
MFSSIIQDEITAQGFFVCLGMAFILGLIVALTHQKTARSSSNFITTLAVLPMLVAMAIMLVNGNLGAGVATMGVFSLVRFRSIAGNSRSILSVFFAMAIGLACGTGYIAFAGIFTVITAVLLLVLKMTKFGESNTQEKKLTILVPEDLDYTMAFDGILGKYTKNWTLIKAKTTNMGSLFELDYLVDLKDGVNEKAMIDTIRERNGNLKVALSHNMIEEEL